MVEAPGASDGAQAATPELGDLPPSVATGSEVTGHLLEVWKKTIDVQQHFNQIEMDIRKTAVTLLATFIGAAGFAADRGMKIALGGTTWNVAFLLVVAGMIALAAFFCMDFFWYHKLLQGAVAHGSALETALTKRGVPVDLTSTIGRFSPVSVFGHKLRSGGKIQFFYGLILVVLAVFAVGAERGTPAPKPAVPSEPIQTIELTSKTAIRADVRLVPDGMDSSPRAALAPQLAPPAIVPTPLPAPAQIRTTQPAPRSSE